MNAIPMSIGILNDLVDKVIESVEKKEAVARRRAIRLAIS
jgi:hypothetical protein